MQLLFSAFSSQTLNGSFIPCNDTSSSSVSLTLPKTRISVLYYSASCVHRACAADVLARYTVCQSFAASITIGLANGQEISPHDLPSLKRISMLPVPMSAGGANDFGCCLGQGTGRNAARRAREMLRDVAHSVLNESAGDIGFVRHVSLPRASMLGSRSDITQQWYPRCALAERAVSERQARPRSFKHVCGTRDQNFADEANEAGRREGAQKAKRLTRLR